MAFVTEDTVIVGYLTFSCRRTLLILLTLNNSLNTASHCWRQSADCIGHVEILEL